MNESPAQDYGLLLKIDSAHLETKLNITEHDLKPNVGNITEHSHGRKIALGWSTYQAYPNVWCKFQGCHLKIMQ